MWMSELACHSESCSSPLLGHLDVSITPQSSFEDQISNTILREAREGNRASKDGRLAVQQSVAREEERHADAGLISR